MKPINVIFEDSEMKTLKKVKGDKTWHDVIYECMTQTEVNEINPFALRALCLEYDLEYRAYPESQYQGYSILDFFLERKRLPSLDKNEEEWGTRLMEIAKIEKKKENE